MKKFLIFLLLLLFSGIASAQYKYAVGVRSGGTSGITIQKNFEYTAIEGILGFWNDGLSITALWEKRTNAFGEPYFYWYYGVGGHVSIYGENFKGYGGPAWYHHPRSNDDGNGDLGVGIDGILGFEYKIPRIPFTVSLDVKPNFEAVTDGGFEFWIDPGIGIQVVF